MVLGKPINGKLFAKPPGKNGGSLEATFQMKVRFECISLASSSVSLV